MEITLEISDDLLKWLEAQAAESECSVTEWINDSLERLQLTEPTYELSMKQYFSREPREFNWIDGRRPTRDELHDRDRLR